MDECMKRIISETHKQKLRENMEKARQARSEKLSTKKAISNGDRQKILEAANILTRILKGISPVFGNGSIDRRSCSICEREYVEIMPNNCVCQEGWRFVGSVEEFLDGKEGH